MRKFEHWQDPGKGISHGWLTAEDLKANDRSTVLVIRAPIGNKILLDMRGAERLYAWLGELIEQERLTLPAGSGG